MYENKDNTEKSATDDFDNYFNEVNNIPVTVDLHPTGKDFLDKIKYLEFWDQVQLPVYAGIRIIENNFGGVFPPISSPCGGLYPCRSLY